MPDELRSRISLTLHACETEPDCGEIALRDDAGVGCPYLLQPIGTVGFPRVDLVPEANEHVYDAVNAGSMDCEEASWLVDAVLFVGPGPDGSVTVSRVVGLTRGPTFTLAAATSPGSSQEARAAADDTSVVPGQRLTVRISGFGAGTDGSMGLSDDVQALVTAFGFVLDETGSATVSLTVPVGATVGPATIWVTGSSPDSRDIELEIPIAIVKP
jgi:hypothetical protein